MSPSLLFMISVIGWTLATVAAVGAGVLRDFSRHDLEAFCRRRQSRRGEHILSAHDRVAHDMRCVEMTAMIVAITTGLTGHFLHYGELQGADPWHIVGLVLVLCLVSLASMVAIPLGAARYAAISLAFHGWPLWRALSLMIAPLSRPGSLIRRLCGLGPDVARSVSEEEEEAFEDEIRSVVSAGLRNGLLEASAGDMIEGIIQLSEADVADIMTPRSRVDSVEVDMPWDALMDFVTTSGRTRIPVYEKSLDNIVGVLYVKDLLAESIKPAQQRASLRALARPAWFTPRTTHLNELLREFLASRRHLAIVVDEYGAVEGVVTIEDVLEEIVGEIFDEADREEEPTIVQIDAFTAEVDGGTHVADVNESLGLELPEGDDYDTVAGLVVARLGRIPSVGEQVTEGGVCLTVLAGSDRRVDRLRLTWGPRASPTAE